MDFTIGIITSEDKEKQLNFIIDSIEKQKIPNYEIVLVGGDGINRDNVVHIPFDELQKDAWITRKKNLITENAKYDNIVYMHDYLFFEDGWYDGFVKNGDDFKICTNVVKNVDGSRFRDWTLWAELSHLTNEDIKKEDVQYIEEKRMFLLPYDMKHLSKYMYISGAYWVAKKSIMEEFPLDESLSWGEGEDVEWSKLVREKYDFTMNDNSSVRFMKPKSMSEFYNVDEKAKNILKKKKINHCIGDSHASIFSGNGGVQPQWPSLANDTLKYFRSYRIGPATAYNSITKKHIIDSIVVNKVNKDEDRIIFCFGEVDCRVHVKRFMNFNKADMRTVVDEIIGRYMTVVKLYKDNGYDVGVWGPIASYPDDNIEKVHLDFMLNYEKVKDFGTTKERNEIAKYFNDKLKEVCEENDIHFMTIFYDMVDDNLLTDKKYLDYAIHLNDKSVPLIINEFEKKKLL